jgi:5'-methylthioadenosine phosphorylase
VAVIGGSGLYHLPELGPLTEHPLDTPYGAPSAPIVSGRRGDTQYFFLARHGAGHRLLPSEINTRANIWALKQLGVEQVVSVSAVGSLQAAIEPLHVVLPDQYIDRTRHRPDTFFGAGLAAHVSLADPTCERMRQALGRAAVAASAAVHLGGTYLCIEGPQFSTRAESNLYRSWGAAVIGMTNAQEVRLCREAEICYASLCLVTDYDCWKVDEQPVTVEAILHRLTVNAELARQIVVHLTDTLVPRSCGCAHALDAAIVTAREAIPAETRRRLGPIVARVLGEA